MIYNRRVAQESCGVKIFYATRIDMKFMVYMENRIDVPTTDILQNMVQSYQANCDLSYHISVRCHGKCLVEIPCGSAYCSNLARIWK